MFVRDQAAYISDTHSLHRYIFVIMIQCVTSLLEKYSIPERTVNQNLAKSIQKHIKTMNKYNSSRPISKHTLKAYESLRQRPHILDAGCGMGKSTRILAQRLDPSLQILGVDRSEHRLDASKDLVPANAKFIRAELADFWLLLHRNQICLDHTCILYPNPYPKHEHLKRRWHAHPIFPFILETTQGLTLRSSWRTYLDEFLLATHIAANEFHFSPAIRLLSISHPQVRPFPSPVHQSELSSLDFHPLTHFEAKYLSVGLPLYELQLGHVPTGLFSHPSSIQ
uniref:tRNA (guanine(46)-N(7))-methyltransferase n=1 Tax=Aureoumbra lagunensis TaxID=44058 RepID=A0A7S3JQS8_9STRA|mmetsp:Transcript_6896/g.9656  ORF Transcript_6896/g.9656 Transcript_6896/m.9656 type:complete len:281 (+) Transcript_6896:151-993(+)